MAADNEAILKVGSPGEEYSLRLIQEEDLPLLLEWRNSPRIRNNMLTNHIITEAEHRAWFERISQLDPALNLMFCYNGCPVGYAGFSDVDWENGTCVPGSYIGDVKGAPKVAGTVLSFLIGDYMFFNLKMRKIYAYVLASNKRALRLQKYFYSQQEGYLKEHVFKDGVYQDVVLFGTMLKDWSWWRDEVKKIFV